jgi:hypothetical protein
MKATVFKGKFSISKKIVIDNKSIKKVSHFTYLGCDITCDTNKDSTIKLNKLRHMCGTLKQTLKNKTRRIKQIKFYKVIAVPTILYGSESWVQSQKDYIF